MIDVIRKYKVNEARIQQKLSTILFRRNFRGNINPFLRDPAQRHPLVAARNRLVASTLHFECCARAGGRGVEFHTRSDSNTPAGSGIQGMANRATFAAASDVPRPKKIIH